MLRKLTDTAVDTHFSSLQFISSAGSWHPAGRRFVFGAIRDGRPALAIVDVDSGEWVGEIRFRDRGEILNPAWSPDGRSIAFSATKGGFSDLFIYDLNTSVLRQITNDAFAELQPAWSPDGRHVAFVTDRFSTDLATLHAGKWQLATLDMSSGEIRALSTFERGKSINPQWAPDGRRLYFLSDQSGITNIYVLDVAAGVLTPQTRVSDLLAKLLNDPSFGLPHVDGTEVPYRAKLSLDLVGQPYVMAGVNQLGAAAGGGLSFLWSDMLGDHNVAR